MKLRRTIATIALFLLLFFTIWIDLPDRYPIKVHLGSFKINKELRTFSINLKIGNIALAKKFETRLGLDLRGGSHLLFEADTSKIGTADKEDAVAAARDIMEKRVNYFGVSEPQVQTLTSGGKYRIAVDLPGIENVQDAIALIGTTAQLEFREIGAEEASKAAALREQIAKQPEATNEAQKSLRQQQEFIAFLSQFKSTGLNGSHVKKAVVQYGGGKGTQVGPTVLLKFNEGGAKKFEEITGRNVGKQLGIFIDGYPITQPPVVQQQIVGGEAVITGNFTLDEAKQLAIAINSGALPVPVKLIEQQNIGPTLGQESIRKSVFAGLVGLSSVMIFMTVYYGKFGVIATVALLIYALISYAIIRTIPVVLTLPGIAGFILSVGMAVDSNILIFERIKEEQRKGKPFHMAMRLGFGKAMDAIKDANIATLLVAFILFNPLNWDFFPQFGMIRGFALTLSIGVLTSLFTGIVITKRIMGAVFPEKPVKGVIKPNVQKS